MFEPEISDICPSSGKPIWAAFPCLLEPLPLGTRMEHDGGNVDRRMVDFCIVFIQVLSIEVDTNTKHGIFESISERFTRGCSRITSRKRRRRH
jgi:hypothetical protein